ncbi:TPA: hypothetical protein DEB00_00530 [Candidatus Uhrbacteria bacterium]|nr:hypothetical protein [Candidatus Uhrbacteria bacterium]
MPDLKNRVWWWKLDRFGGIVDRATLAQRLDGDAPLKNGSPFTPRLLENGEFPPTHLHHHRGRKIIGIHGESDLTHLRVTLLLCLRHEEMILQELSGRHHSRLLLYDVLPLLPRVREISGI